MLSKDNLVLIGTMILENRTSNEIREIYKIGNGNLTRFRKALRDSALTPEKMEKWKRRSSRFWFMALLRLAHQPSLLRILKRSMGSLKPKPSYDAQSTVDCLQSRSSGWISVFPFLLSLQTVGKEGSSWSFCYGANQEKSRGIHLYRLGRRYSGYGQRS